MATFRLVLRFGEFNPNVDTIRAHNEVIATEGYVLWGWWRKIHEPDRSEDVTKLAQEVPFQTYLLDRRSQRLFTALVSQVMVDAKSVDPTHVPTYCQEEIRRIQVWFRIEKPIDQSPYDRNLASRTGEPTFMLIGESAQVADTRSSTANGVVPSVAIHVSDLHFGDEHAFQFGSGTTGIAAPAKDLAHAIIDDINRLSVRNRIGVLIVSGDLTTKARWDAEFMDSVVDAMDTLREGLGVPKNRVLIVPGNHDFIRPQHDAHLDPAIIAQRSAVRYDHEDKFRFFLNQWLDRKVSLPLSRCMHFECEGFELCIGALNSSGLTATEFTEYGYVGDALEEVLVEMDKAQRAIKVLVLHHHLVPIAYVEAPTKRGVSLTLDASKILELAQKHGVQIILHGHQHIPKVIKTAQVYFADGTWRGLSEEDVFILASGSAGSNRLARGLSNTYSILEFGLTNASITYRKIDPMGQELGDFISTRLPVMPC